MDIPTTACRSPSIPSLSPSAPDPGAGTSRAAAYDPCRDIDDAERSRRPAAPSGVRSSGRRARPRRAAGGSDAAPRAADLTPDEARPLTVLVVGLSHPPETFLDRLLSGLAQRGVQIVIMSRVPPDATWLGSRSATWVYGPAPASPRAIARVVRRTETDSIQRARTLLRGVRARGTDAAGTRATAGVDVVYAPWINTLADHPYLFDVAPVLTSLRGTQVTIEPWDPGKPEQGDRLRRVFERATRVHAVSQAIRDAATTFGLDPAIAQVITPAVDPEAFKPNSAQQQQRPLRAIAVGALLWRKDYETALLAIRRAVDRGTDVHLTVIGDGEDRQHMVYAVSDLDLGDRVTLAGRRRPAEVADMLADSDVFLHTSSSEGISNAVLEAMASELAVVTSDAGGMREAVRDGIDGFVVPVRDSAGFGAALSKLADDPQLRSRLAVSARARVMERFRLDQQLDAFSALLRETASSPR